MARRDYEAKLDALRENVTGMADTALERYDTALDVLETGDAEAANRVIEGDHELNKQYLDLESDCIELLALEQPVAGDLRFVASSFKIITDIERVGDLATNLARYGREAGGGLENHAQPVGASAGEMVADAVAAYAADDAEAVREIAARDDALDEACRGASEAVIRDLIGGTREANLERASRALLTIRDIERVADHAVNICARTLYMVEYDDSLIY